MDIVDIYRRMLRILLIIYKFSDKEGKFESEVRLQKIEFFMRNPDHFSLYLLKNYKNLNLKDLELKKIIQELINQKEMDVRIDSMMKYRFGAYEKLDEVYSLLKSYNFININDNNHHKVYEVKKEGKDYIEFLKKEGTLKWYFLRVELLFKFLKDLKATELKNIQYESSKYKKTVWTNIIPSELETVKLEYKNLFKEEL